MILGKFGYSVIEIILMYLLKKKKNIVMNIYHFIQLKEIYSPLEKKKSVILQSSCLTK